MRLKVKKDVQISLYKDGHSISTIIDKKWFIDKYSFVLRKDDIIDTDKTDTFLNRDIINDLKYIKAIEEI